MTQAIVRLPLINQLLAEQQRVTVVERFAQRHEANELPLQEPYYSDRIPLSKPGRGEQYAFHVDVDACTGCKACVTACHRLNGLDEGEAWRSVGVLHGGTASKPVQRTITTACHHCVDPACAKGCPVNAYEKDPETGIVRHLDDQCIGCQYCVFTCPYEVPKFNERLGIVRKCDMCAGRLEAGEAPACVQACPNGAISIRVIDQAAALDDAQSETFLPGAPSPAITVPTTTYETAQPLPRNVMPADYHDVRPATQHMPVVIMLVLTQLSVGAFAVEWLLRALEGDGVVSSSRPYHAGMALLFGLLALGASVLHLGRPLYAYRALIGLRTSWLSREILAFGGFAGLAMLYAAEVWFEPLSGRLSLPLGTLETALASGVVGTGVLGLLCSVMLYHVTGRRFWHASQTGPRFFSTSVVLGLASSFWVLVLTLEEAPGAENAREWVAMALVGAVSFELLLEATIFLHLRDKRFGDLRRTATLMTGPLTRQTAWRFGLGLFGGVVLPGLGLLTRFGSSHQQAAMIATVIFVSLVSGEVLERRLFFSAVSAPRMPGTIGG